MEVNAGQINRFKSSNADNEAVAGSSTTGQTTPPHENIRGRQTRSASPDTSTRPRRSDSLGGEKDDAKLAIHVRHGETYDNVMKGEEYHLLGASESDPPVVSTGKVLSGQNEVSLDRKGWSQGVETGQAMGPEIFKESLIVVSPQLRAQQTLDAALEGAGLTRADVTVQADPRFKERAAGEVEGMTWEEAAEVFPEMKKGKEASVFTDAQAKYPGEAGESLALVGGRVAPGIKDAFRSNNEKVIIFSHELTIKSSLGYQIKGKVDNDTFKIEVKNGEPIVTRRGEDGWARTGEKFEGGRLIA